MLEVKPFLFQEAFVDVEAGASTATSSRFYKVQKTLGIIYVVPRIIRKLPQDSIIGGACNVPSSGMNASERFEVGVTSSSCPACL